MINTSPPPAVETRHLIKRYKRKTAVNGISLRIHAGETFGVLGTNGAGKTTTMEMIAGLRKPTEGSVRILGLDPFTDRARSVRYSASNCSTPICTTH